MSEKTKPVRIDQWLVDNGFFESRSRAQAFLLTGDVLVNEEPITKAGHLIRLKDVVRLRQKDHPYVSRGALKLQHAFTYFKINVQDEVALDVGASTGGFTEILLENGVKRVHAVDVGKDQLAWKIRKDARVKVYENLHAKNISLEILGEKPSVIVIDVSFISLEKVIPFLLPISSLPSKWITLIKPQFEAGKEEVGKGGIIRNEEVIQKVVSRITLFGENLGLKLMGVIESPILGGSATQPGEGNKEYLAYWKREE